MTTMFLIKIGLSFITYLFQRYEYNRPWVSHNILSLLEPDQPRELLHERHCPRCGSVVVQSAASSIMAAASGTISDYPGRLGTRRLQSDHGSSIFHSV
jgi:hypothetical protein